MKQLYCPHRVTVSGILQYCNNGKFPVDCEHCDCPDKQELDVTVTIGSVIRPKNKTNSPYVMCYGLDGRQVSQENSSKKEVLDTSEMLSDEMKSDAEVADDLGILPSEYRDLVTNALFEEKPKLKVMTREEELELGSYQAYPSQVEYSSVGDCLKDYNAEQRQIWLEGAKWADKTLLDNACEWLLSHNDYQRVLDNGKDIRFDMTQCVTDFRKAMEE